MDSNSNKPFVYRTELNWWYRSEHSHPPQIRHLLKRRKGKEKRERRKGGKKEGGGVKERGRKKREKEDSIQEISLDM